MLLYINTNYFLFVYTKNVQPIIAYCINLTAKNVIFSVSIDNFNLMVFNIIKGIEDFILNNKAINFRNLFIIIVPAIDLILNSCNKN